MKKAIMFPGQGIQKKGMGADLFRRFAGAVKNADSILGYSILDLCMDPARLGKTEYTQVAIYVVNALTYRKFIEEGGAVPDFFLGHSLGELNALQAAGVFSFERGLEIVKKRGELMSHAPPGSMAAVIGCSIDELKRFLASRDWELDIANLNSPSQTVVSGRVKDVDTFCAAVKSKWTTIPLRTGGAFHSRHMAEAAGEFANFLSEHDFDEPGIPVVRNLDGGLHRKKELVSTLSSQLNAPVDWVRSVENLLDSNVDEFLEMGDGKVLTRLVSEIRSTYDKSNVKRTRRGVEVKLRPFERVSDWNQRFPSGTRVKLKTTGELRETRSEAMLLFGSISAIYLLGCKRYVELEQVDALG